MATITEAQLKLALPASNAMLWVEPLNISMERFKIETPEQVAMFLAQIGHESADLTRLEENLNYSAQGLANTWSRFSSTGERGGPPNSRAIVLARHPIEIASEVYSNRMGNGPPGSGDGWAFRGRGPIQATGRQMYNAIAQAIGYNVVESPDLLLDPVPGALSAAWIFMVEKNCGMPASIGDVLTCSQRINGSRNPIGLRQREAKYEEIHRVLTA